jgi:hypothetical protein
MMGSGKLLLLWGRAGLTAVVAALALGLFVVLAGASDSAQAGHASPDVGSAWKRWQLTGSSVADVDAVSSTDAWSVGSDGLFAHWDGVRWTAVDNTKLIGTSAVHAVDMLASNQVWATSTQARFLRYDGANWVLESSNVPTNLSMSNISMVSPTYGWAAGTSANFARYDGTTWTHVVPGGTLTSTINGIDMVSTTDGWAVTGTADTSGRVGKLARFNGTTWQQAFTTNRILYDVDMLDANYGWAVGEGGTLLRYDGTTWQTISPPDSCSLSCTAAFLVGVYTVSQNEAYAVGSTNISDANLWRWNGTVWTEMQGNPNYNEPPLNAVFMLSSSDGWAVGERGTLYRYNGTAWTTTNSHWTSNGFYGLDFLTPNDGWTVGVLNNNPAAHGLQHWNGTDWQVYVPPSFSPTMFDVAMVASNDVWAAGSQAFFHWDGSTWTNFPSTGNFLSAISMVSATDGWAVGSSGDIVHYNGTAWTNYTSPTTTNLWSIDMVDANEGWAGGTLGLMLHYQNGTWTQISPNPGGSTIEGIHMLNANEGWAVGFNGMILRYQNGTWTQVSSPTTARLNNVYTVSSTEAWAVGEAPTGASATILRYQGGAWNTILSPTGRNLRDVHIFPDGSGWAVGESPGSKIYLGNIFGQPTPTVTGTPPTATGTPVPSATSTVTAGVPTSTSLASVTPVPPTGTSTVLPTGTATSILPTLTILVPTATSTVVVPSVTASVAPATVTGTPGVATETATVPAGTATATSMASPTVTACTLHFTDVQVGHTFYPFVQCLACQGIIGGYACGGAFEPCDAGDNPYFRPNNDITRGQISKIVSQSAGFSEPAGTRIYEDVPEASPFFTWIQRLSNRGLVGGYRCGLIPDEPCVGPENRPYFRPNANATRGQLSKIVASAAGLTGTPTGQRYADVAEDSAFYVWIEQLSALGVMGGYACGSVSSEPCDDQDRPYFRPSNNVTRGQASKIVANTFFPGSQASSSP